MSSTPVHDDDHGYLTASRQQILASVAGLSEFDLRWPRTPTGTNLLGVVKHLVGIEAGYLGLCLGQPFGEPLPWIDGPSGPNADMWATADESCEYVVGLYQRACEHSDAVIAGLDATSPAHVPWWPPATQVTTAEALIARVLKDTAMHAGQLQILRELIDGQAGRDHADLGDDAWWNAYRQDLEQVARRFADDDR